MAMVAEVAISLVIHNSLLMLSEEKILSRGLRDQVNAAVNDLRNKLVTSELLESGTENEQQSSDRSRLLEGARGAVEVANKVLLEASQLLTSHKGRLAKIRASVNFMSQMKHVRATKKMVRVFITKVNELSAHLSHLNHGENASSSNAPWGNVRWNKKVESDIVGRENEAGELLARLTFKDGDQDALKLRIVSVVGGEAIGKTALVRSVYNRLDIDHRFQCRVWVHVPEEFTLKGLLVKILKQTPQTELKDLEHMEQENLEEILHKSLMELRYLIVFDDLHVAKVMDELMILLADSRNGSRVIVTARDTKIASLLDPWASPLELKQLDAKQLVAKLSKCSCGECGSLAEDLEWMPIKCSDSPLSILLVRGLAMASGDSSLVLVDQQADNSALNNIVSLSYCKLPSLFKPCLLYLCLFPRDSEIPTRRLFRLWLAEGLVLVPWFTAMECFEELVGRNLVHVVRRRKRSGRPKSCRLPGFLHDFLCKMATQLRLLQIHSDTKCTYYSEQFKVVNGCLWIVKYQENNYHQESQQRSGTEDHQQGNIQLQHLRSYVSFKTQKKGTPSRDVEELLRPLISKGDCGPLRVLDLEGVYKPLLPDGLGNILLNLRYLGLRWTALDSIPESVGNMSLLETLDLKHTNVRNLPSSIWKVKSLQHLYMNEVCLDKPTSASPKYSNNFQTLWGLSIGAAKSPMLDVLSESTRLKKLGLTCKYQVVNKVTEKISALTTLESLKLRSVGPIDQPSKLELSNMRELGSLSELYLLGGLPEASLRLLPQKLKILTLSMSGLKREDDPRGDDPMSVLGKLESLEMLNLFAGSYTGLELHCGENSFPRLRVLKLWMLEGVEKASVEESALCCLEELEIKNCGSLTSIGSLHHIVPLKQISLIKVSTELAANIKDGLTKKKRKDVFIKEKQIVSSSSSSSTEATEARDEEQGAENGRES